MSDFQTGAAGKNVSPGFNKIIQGFSHIGFLALDFLCLHPASEKKYASPVPGTKSRITEAQSIPCRFRVITV
jgi:hypothetical protein